MIGRDIERVLASLSVRTASELSTISVELRRAGLLPKGGRGPNAPEYSAEHTANLLIGAAAAVKASRAAETTVQYANLKSWDSGQESSFLKALSEVLINKKLRDAVIRVRICRSFPVAIITLHTYDNEFHYFDENILPDFDVLKWDEMARGLILNWVEIGGDILRMLSLAGKNASLATDVLCVMKMRGEAEATAPPEVLAEADRLIARVKSLIDNPRLAQEGGDG